MAKASIKLHGEGARPNAPQAGRAVAPRPPQLVRLGEVSQVNYGTRIRSKDSTSDAYPVYGGGGKTFGWAEFNRENQCVVSRFAMSEECVRFVSGKFFLNDSGLTVDADDVNIQQEYLNWFLLGHQREIYSLGRGCAQKNLRVDSFLDIQIPLPPLPEQKRIAAILDKICEMKRNAEARLQKLDLLVKARFVEMFDSAESEARKCKAIEDICCLIADCPHTTAQDEGAGYPLVRTPNIGKGRLVYDKMHYVSEAVYNQRNKRAVPCARDLILAREAPAGNIAVIQQDEKVCLGQRTVLLRPNLAIIDSEYMAYRILSEKVQRTILGYSSGSTVAHLNVREIRKLEIVLPPLALQRQFAAFVEKVEGLKATAKKELEQVDLLYRAKLQEFFG